MYTEATRSSMTIGTNSNARTAKTVFDPWLLHDLMTEGQLDSTDQAIIVAVALRGLSREKQIAEHIGIARSTVKRRIDKLRHTL
jgi:DNA-binding MarR family transcriptional regulator